VNTSSFVRTTLNIYRLKGQCHEIFDLWFFHQTIPPDSKAFLNSASNSPRYDRFSDTKIVNFLKSSTFKLV
jgi:hypothetical protein